MFLLVRTVELPPSVIALSGCRVVGARLATTRLPTKQLQLSLLSFASVLSFFRPSAQGTLGTWAPGHVRTLLSPLAATLVLSVPC